MSPILIAAQVYLTGFVIAFAVALLIHGLVWVVRRTGAGAAPQNPEQP
jgi:hypothetical protein